MFVDYTWQCMKLPQEMETSGLFDKYMPLSINTGIDKGLISRSQGCIMISAAIGQILNYHYPSPTHSVWEGYCSRRVS